MLIDVLAYLADSSINVARPTMSNREHHTDADPHVVATQEQIDRYNRWHCPVCDSSKCVMCKCPVGDGCCENNHQWWWRRADEKLVIHAPSDDDSKRQRADVAATPPPRTWRTCLKAAFAKTGDTTLTSTMTDAELDAPLSPGYGISCGCSFTAWGETHVYFPVVYDGNEWVGYAPRNPCDKKTRHQGGQ